MVDKVILYNIGRFQEDFEYIFDSVKVEKYVDEELESYNGIECIKFDDLVNYKGTLVVICDRKDNKYHDKFSKIKFKEGENFVFLEDLGKYLDVDFTKEELFIRENMDYRGQHESIPNSEMFKQMIYDEPKFEYNCTMPFNYVQIQTFGYTYPCCNGWSKYPLGNIYFTSPDEVWHSYTAKLYRRSILNKTYSFCNEFNCPFLCDKDAEKSKKKKNVVTKVPETVCLAYDYTCNLHCKSCRNCAQNYNDDIYHNLLFSDINKKLNDSRWTSDSKDLIIASQGETFMSDAYKSLLFSEELNRESITIHTNGTLLNSTNLEKLYKKYKDISILISIDAATKETYSKIRLGGNFDALMNNLKLISEERKQGKIKSVSILFVLQSGNYKELPDACRLAIDFGFDVFDASRIANWYTYTEEEFKDISMYDECNNPKPELEQILKDPIFKSKDIIFKGNIFK